MSKKLHGTLNANEKSLLETFCYFGVFNYPISFFKLCTYSSAPNAAIAAIALHSLVKKKLVEETNGLYLLKGLPAVDYGARKQASLEALKFASDISAYLARLPWINLLAVTGSTAACNKAEDDDIDIFIITQTNRLWITRFFVYILLKCLGVYRTDLNSKNKVCPNLLVVEDNSSWENAQNLYIAFEIVTMVPLISRQNAYFEFLAKNQWVQQFFPNFAFCKPTVFSIPASCNRIMNALEQLFFKLQLFYMRSKKTTETATAGIAHFNKFDSKPAILDTFSNLKIKSHLD